LIDWHNAGDGGYAFGTGIPDFNAFISNAVDFFDHMSNLYANIPNMLYEIWSEPAWLEWRIIKYYHYNVMKVRLFLIIIHKYEGWALTHFKRLKVEAKNSIAVRDSWS